MKILNKLKILIQLYYTSMFTRDDKLLIFGSWLGEKYADNPRYLYEYIVENRPDLKAVWITKNQEVFQKLHKRQYPVMMAEKRETRKIVKKAKYIFTATGIFDIGSENASLVGGAYSINLWHGIPLKKIMYDDEFSPLQKRNIFSKLLDKFPLRHYFVISTSSAITQIYQSAFQVNQSSILELGQPRNDYFFDDSYPESSIMKIFNNKKIIAYMPTHRNEGSKQINLQELMDLERLNQWCEKTNTIFVIKKHFYHSKEENLIKSYSSIIDVTNEKLDAQELLKYADILITDYSSCYIDYLLLNRPILFYNFDYDDYLKKDRSLYFPYEDVTPGAKCQSFNELFETLQYLYLGEDDYRQEREKMKSFFYSERNQGPVSKQILDYILNL